MQKYTVSLTTKLKPPQSGLIVIEPEDYTVKEVQALKDSGAKVLAYLSAGSVSDERAYFGQLEPYCFDRKLDDWPHERYLDLRYPKAREWMQTQAKAFKKMGFDGYWIDNLDVYEEFRTTDLFKAITSTLIAIKAVGGYVMINGGRAYITDLIAPHKVQLGAYNEKSNAKRMKQALKDKNFSAAIIEMDGYYKVQAGAFGLQKNADQLADKLCAAGLETAKRITLTHVLPKAAADGVTQEEVFSLITSYKGRGKFGRQDPTESEQYQAHIRRVIKNGLGAFLLEYTDDPVMKLRIRAFSEAAGVTGYYISGDVNL